MFFSTVLQSIFSLSFLGVLVTDLSVRVPPAAEAPPCVFQVLREAICGVDLESTRVKLVKRFVTRQRSGAKSTGRITS